MPDIIAAADSIAVTTLFHDAEAALGTITRSGSGSFGPFGSSYSASASFSGGSANLQAPVVQIANCGIRYSVSLDFSLDLSDFLPHVCLPQVCIPFTTICTPPFCIDWPTLTVPFSFGDTVEFTADLTPVVQLSAAVWTVEIVIVSIPSLQFGAVTAGILLALGVALGSLLAPIPFIGPFLAAAVVAIVAAIGVAGLTGLLGLIITPFVAGQRFTVYSRPKLFPLLAASGPVDPAANITVTALTAGVVSSDKQELVIDASISA